MIIQNGILTEIGMKVLIEMIFSGTQWMEEYDYDSNVEIEHAKIVAIAPSLLVGNTVYFHLYNNPVRRWAVCNNLEDAMFAGLY